MTIKKSLTRLFMGVLLAGIVLLACEEESSEPSDAINTFSLTVQNQFNGSAATALCLVSLTQGKAYNAADAKNNQAAIDFVYYQYTGTNLNKDSYFYGIAYLKSHPSGYEQSIRDALGIQSWTTLTESIITRTSELSEADFNAIDNAADLREAANGVSNTKAEVEMVTTIEGQPVTTIFAFQATGNKVGLLKLKAARTGTGGGIDIDIKVEK